jgi:hypothetical protein
MTFLEKIKSEPESIHFQEVIAYIDSNYEFTPTRFTNGNTINEPNQNNGSCKIFNFAKSQSLSKIQTLNLFGNYYRKDVLENPAGSDHQNIRSFIKTGWEGIIFESQPLRKI